MSSDKLRWEGVVRSVQPRIRLRRSFDERSHSYLGYVLIIEGTIGDEARLFRIGIGKAAQAKHRFSIGDRAHGQSVPVADSRLETAEYYKTSALKLVDRAGETTLDPPPYLGVLPDLAVYRARGHRRLASRTYDTQCTSCIWGCRMPVEMIIDHWNPSQKRYRFETFCYGPKACSSYRAGPTRKVPGRRGMSWEEEDWVDEEATAHREPEE